MALDELQKRIERDAAAEASRIGEEAEAEAARILGAAREKAAGIKAAARAAAQEEARHRKEDALLSLDDEIGGMLAAAKEEAVNAQLGSFTKATAGMLALHEREIIKSAIKGFSRAMPLEGSVIKIGKENADLAEKTGARVERAGIRGAVICSRDGMIVADASIDGITASNAEPIRRALAEGLFG